MRRCSSIKLNARQKKFCEHYVSSGNATASALKAGYSNTYSKNRSHELLKKVEVCGYIKELSSKIKNNRIMNMREIQEFWASVVKDNDNKLADRIKASELIAKTKGAFIDKERLQLDKEAVLLRANIEVLKLEAINGSNTTEKVIKTQDKINKWSDEVWRDENDQ